MVIDMNEDRLVTLAQLRQFVAGTTDVTFRRKGAEFFRPHACGCVPGGRGIGSTGNNESIVVSADRQAACFGGGRCCRGRSYSVHGDHDWG